MVCFIDISYMTYLSIYATISYFNRKKVLDKSSDLSMLYDVPDFLASFKKRMMKDLKKITIKCGNKRVFGCIDCFLYANWRLAVLPSYKNNRLEAKKIDRRIFDYAFTELIPQLSKMYSTARTRPPALQTAPSPPTTTLSAIHSWAPQQHRPHHYYEIKKYEPTNNLCL